MAPPGVPLKKPVIPNVLLPCLNWVPIRNPEHTIFKVCTIYTTLIFCVQKRRTVFMCTCMDASIQDLDDESVLETVDFSEFEALFQVKRFKKNAKFAKREDS